MEAKANSHHLVLGTSRDYLSGKKIPDTLDERYRQAIARSLVEQCRFNRNEISAGIEQVVSAGSRRAKLKIDFSIAIDGKTVMVIKYAPGSLVTRRISTLALSRILSPVQIPYAVITNGEDAEVIDGETGAVVFNGIENIPDRDFIMAHFSTFPFSEIREKVFDQASRIAFACEIDGACPCDSDVCMIDEAGVDINLT